MLQAFLLSFGVIFVAELGDKSQLMAMAFAARYRAVPILIGIAIATAIVHAFSVFVGAAIGDRIPTTAITLIAGVAFFGLRGLDLAGRQARRGRRGQGRHDQPIGDRGGERGVLPR